MKLYTKEELKEDFYFKDYEEVSVYECVYEGKVLWKKHLYVSKCSRHEVCVSYFYSSEERGWKLSEYRGKGIRKFKKITNGTIEFEGKRVNVQKFIPKYTCSKCKQEVDEVELNSNCEFCCPDCMDKQ